MVWDLAKNSKTEKKQPQTNPYRKLYYKSFILTTIAVIENIKKKEEEETIWWKIQRQRVQANVRLNESAESERALVVSVKEIWETVKIRRMLDFFFPLLNTNTQHIFAVRLFWCVAFTYFLVAKCKLCADFFDEGNHEKYRAVYGFGWQKGTVNNHSSKDASILVICHWL